MDKVAYDRPVPMSGDQLRNARVRAKMTRQELADRIGASLKSIGNWERSRVPTNQEPLVRGVLFSSNPLEAYTHWELLSEVGRRMDAWLRAETDDEDADNDSNVVATDASAVGQDSSAPAQPRGRSKSGRRQRPAVASDGTEGDQDDHPREDDDI